MGNELMVDLQSVLTLIGDAILLRANDPEQFHYLFSFFNTLNDDKATLYVGRKIEPPIHHTPLRTIKRCHCKSEQCSNTIITLTVSKTKI